jgi:hypothetical protein
LAPPHGVEWASRLLSSECLWWVVAVGGALGGGPLNKCDVRLDLESGVGVSQQPLAGRGGMQRRPASASSSIAGSWWSDPPILSATAVSLPSAGHGGDGRKRAGLVLSDVGDWRSGSANVAYLRNNILSACWPATSHAGGQPLLRSGSQSSTTSCSTALGVLMKGICPRGNNKVVIILFRVHNRCLFFMLELY